MPAVSLERQNLLRWCVWFYLGHVVLFWLIGLIYLPAIPRFNVSFSVNILVMLSYFAHLAMLAISPCLIMAFFIWIIPWRHVVFALAILVATVFSSLLFIDTLVFNLYKFHLNSTLLVLAFHGITKGVLGLSLFEKILGPIIICCFLIMECLYARWLWRKLLGSQILATHLTKILTRVIGVLSVAIFASLFIIAFNVNQKIVRILLEKTRFLPLYVEVFSLLIPAKEENFAFLRIDSKNPQQWLTADTNLNYPVNTLQFTNTHESLNLIIIAIDTWRFDMLNEEVTPNLLEFAKKSWFFTNHFSGGNSTLPGIFTLFYGLPATYINAMETQQQTPVLLDKLAEQHYQLGIFSSAPLHIPPMHRSIFHGIKNLDVEKSAESVYDRDTLVTRKFEKFILNREVDKPFFSFLFFDAAHSYCGSDEIPGPFSPTAENCNRITFSKKRDYELYFNRYKNAIFSVDQQVLEVLKILQNSNLLNNTVVIIVGDHGEEFDDSGNGYYGHASNFSRYQVQTPLIVYWPHEKPQVITHQTSHFDIVPTLLTKFFGCLNPYSDYSVGTSLLNQQQRPYFVISSYVDFGVVEPERITTIYSTGSYHIEKLDGQILPGENFNLAIMREVVRELHRFYN